MSVFASGCVLKCTKLNAARIETSPQSCNTNTAGRKATRTPVMAGRNAANPVKTKPSAAPAANGSRQLAQAASTAPKAGATARPKFPIIPQWPKISGSL